MKKSIIVLATVLGISLAGAVFASEPVTATKDAAEPATHQEAEKDAVKDKETKEVKKHRHHSKKHLKHHKKEADKEKEDGMQAPSGNANEAK